MVQSDIQRRLAERFAAPLPEFHKRRILWRDEDESVDKIDELIYQGEFCQTHWQ